MNENHKFSSSKEGYLLQSQHISSISGVQHSYIIQTFNDIPVFNAVMSVHIMPDGSLLEIHNQFIVQPELVCNSPESVIDSDSALSVMFKETGFENEEIPELLYQGNDAKITTRFRKPSFLQDEIELKLIYFPAESGEVRLAWETYLHKSQGSEWWHIMADAENGRILYKHNLYISCHFGCKSADCNHNNSNPSNNFKEYILSEAQQTLTGSYKVFPLGIESPSHGNRELVVSPADPVASPFGWHDTNGQPGHEFTTTKGNNVEAREDLDGNNNTLGAMADGGSNLIFDFPFNPSSPPVQNQNASITNLFYWNNIMHDIWYRYGFTEAAGNFQQNNYSNGGLANDFVRADAMDGSGTNNANFATPVDGSNPRMQMFIWNASSTQLTVNTPPAAAGNYTSAVAGFGPQVFNISGQVILASDGTANPTLACNALTNGSAIGGKIAMVDRGSCEFGVKCLNAQNAGAVAVIVCNNASGAPISMAPGAVGNQVNIPCIMISQADCNLIRVQIPNLTVSILATGSIQLDSDFDNGVIAHEYGHGISIRLTGGAANSSCLNNQEQMGEGWSDWFGLMLTIKPEHTPSTPRGVGTFLLGQPTTGQGIRSYPYSTDMTVNPMTYDFIKTLNAPHGVGSVWSTMVWELAWLLIKEYGYDPDLYTGTGGNNIAMKLVTEALKLQPCSPGFVSGRDAILQADVAMYGGKHQCIIWEAFAKRGLGFSALQGSTNNKNDGTQAFDMPASCCSYVMNTQNSGGNSLRSAISCAAMTDTIRFSPNLYGQNIQLTSGSVILNKNLHIGINPDKYLGISSNGNFPVFTVENNNVVSIENIELSASSNNNTDARVIFNSGNLTLHNVIIKDTPGQINGSSVFNEGSLTIRGVTNIR